MFSLESTNLVKLTPEVARQFSEMPTFKGDRPRDPHRVAHLTARLEEGTFISPKWAVAVLDGFRYRINGGHSSYVLANANGKFPRGMHALVEEFICETERDVAELFDQFDSPISTRTKAESTKAHAASHVELSGFNPTAISALAGGAAAAMSRMGESKRLDRNACVRLVHSEQDFIAWGIPLTKPAWLKVTAILAAAYATYSVDRTGADRFWTQVRTGEDMRPGAEALRAFLMGRVRNTNERDRWKPRAIYAKCIHGWNAWRRNEPCSKLPYFSNAPLPEPA